MSYLNPPYEDNFKELCASMPLFYLDVFEMRAILRAQGGLLDGFCDAIERVVNNNFIDTADAETITELEKFLHISLERSRTLEERRRLVKAFFVGFGKVSASMLAAMIQSYTNAPVDIYFEPSDEERNNTLFIDMERGDSETLYMSDIILLLSKKLPAHINWRAAIIYKISVVTAARWRHYIFEYPFAGTMPDTSTLGSAFSITSVTKPSRTYYKRDYWRAGTDELAGTLPETATLGNTHAIASVTRPQQTHYKSDNRQAGLDEEAGVLPDTSTLAALVRGETVTKAKASNYTTNYKEAGVLPDTSVLAALIREETVTEARASNYTTDYERAGERPQAASLRDNNIFNAGAGVKISDFGIDYIFCGETSAE